MTLRHFQICCYLQLNTQSENINYFINFFSIMICIKIFSAQHMHLHNIITAWPTCCIAAFIAHNISKTIMFYINWGSRPHLGHLLLIKSVNRTYCFHMEEVKTLQYESGLHSIKKLWHVKTHSVQIGLTCQNTSLCNLWNMSKHGRVQKRVKMSQHHSDILCT